MLPCWLLLLAGLSAQVRTITGSVASPEGEALIGATVQVESSRRGTATDAQGNFAIEAATGETLRFYYTGYTTRSITVGNEILINVVLEANDNVLNETVVVGYGTQKKERPHRGRLVRLRPRSCAIRSPPTSTRPYRAAWPGYR